MANRHSNYNKEILWSRRLSQKTDIARESVYLSAIDRKLTSELNSNFQLLHRYFFLKYVTKIFCISYYFQEKIWECFKVQLSVAVSVYILSSKGANRLQVLYIRTLGNIQGIFLHRILSYWGCGPQCIPSNIFLDICRSFRTASEVLGQHHFGVLLIYWVLNAFILLHLTKDMLFDGDLQKIVFLQKIL